MIVLETYSKSIHYEVIKQQLNVSKLQTASESNLSLHEMPISRMVNISFESSNKLRRNSDINTETSKYRNYKKKFPNIKCKFI